MARGTGQAAAGEKQTASSSCLKLGRGITLQITQHASSQLESLRKGMYKTLVVEHCFKGS
jgi:hypothetical protein